MLSRRLASAAVIVVVLIALICFDFQLGRIESMARPGLILAVIAVAVAMLSAGEQGMLFRQQQPDLNIRLLVLISGVSVAICSLPVLWREYPADCSVGIFGWAMLAITFAVGMTLLYEIVTYSGDGQATNRICRSVLIHLLTILLFCFLVAHRLLQRDNSTGMIALITLISAVKMSDAAAYFTGKSIGRQKMAPQLSPGKTVQGGFGGVVGAWIGAAIVVYLVAPLIFKSELVVPFWWLLVYGVAVSVAGIVGDLTESLFKRDANLKDSSSWIPGLGGILDVTDSLVFAAPVSFFFWVLLNGTHS